jgi:hypothetical protein
MPEQLTKYPEVTIHVLRSAGAKCGEGSVQEILTKCPAESFCKLPRGEVCVYGLADASKMTQISTSELQALVAAPPPSATGALLLSRRRLCSFRGCGFGCSCGQATPRVAR